MTHYYDSEGRRSSCLGWFIFGAIVGGIISWYICSSRGPRFGGYTLSTENGRIRVENILRVDGEPKYQVNFRNGNIESLVEVNGFQVVREGKGFEARAVGVEYLLRRTKVGERLVNE